MYRKLEQEVEGLQERIDELEENDSDFFDQNDFDDEQSWDNCTQLENELDFRNKLYGNVAKSLGDLRKEYSDLESKLEQVNNIHRNLQNKHNITCKALQKKEEIQSKFNKIQILNSINFSIFLFSFFYSFFLSFFHFIDHSLQKIK